MNSPLAQETALTNSREAKAEERNNVQEGERPDPIAALIGTLNLGTMDLSENHDDYLAKALEKELESCE
jgi:hypothetical protein